MIWLSVAIVLGVIVSGNIALAASRKASRKSAARLREGEELLLKLLDQGADVTVERDLPTGLRKGKTRVRLDMVLSSERLVIATHHGKLLEFTGADGSVRSTGPSRLVLEGQRAEPVGATHVRVDIVTPTAIQWAEMAEEHLSTSRSA